QRTDPSYSQPDRKVVHSRQMDSRSRPMSGPLQFQPRSPCIQSNCHYEIGLIVRNHLVLTLETEDAMSHKSLLGCGIAAGLAFCTQVRAAEGKFDNLSCYAGQAHVMQQGEGITAGS